MLCSLCYVVSVEESWLAYCHIMELHDILLLLPLLTMDTQRNGTYILLTYFMQGSPPTQCLIVYCIVKCTSITSEFAVLYSSN